MTDVGPRERARGREEARRPPRARRGADAAADARRATRRGLTVLGAIAALGCLQVVFMIGVELDRTIRHRASIDALETELAGLAREAEGLRAVVAHADDDAFREQLARRQGFMRPDEIRVVVVPVDGP